MVSLKRYFDFMQQYPHLFHNPDEEGVLRVITDPDRIRGWREKRRAELKKDGQPLEWAEIGILVDDPYFWVIRDLVEFPDGWVNGYIRFVNRKSLEGGYDVVIMLVQAGKILLIRKFRHEDRRWYWEFPRGFGETGLSAEENARKELEEEIGVVPEKLIEVGRSSESDRGGLVYYYGELPRDASIVLDEREGIIEKVFLGFEELTEWLVDGKVRDGFTINAFTLATTKSLL